MSGTELERMIIRLVGDGSSYMQMMKDAQTQSNQTGVAMTRMENTARSVIGTFAALGASASLIGLSKQAVKLAGEAEQMQISFGTMLQSASKGIALTKDLQKLAADTPMTLPGLQRGAKTLLQFGATGKEIIPTLRAIGDVTGGNEEQFQHMALALGQVMGAGRLMGQEVLQMVNAGFNPLEEMARTTGKSMAQLRGEMEQGRITVDMVFKAFKTATGEGGKFNDMMRKQSQSLVGLFSTLTDDFGAFLRVVGETTVETLRLKDAIRGLSSMAQDAVRIWETLPNPIKMTAQYVGSAGIVFLGLVTTLGLGKMALSGLLSIIGPVVSGIAGYVTWANLATAATVAWQVALAAGLVYAFVTVINKIRETGQAMKEFNEQQRIGGELANRAAIAQGNRQEKVLANLPKERKERMAQLGQLIADADKEIAGKMAGVDMAKANVKGANADVFDQLQDAIWGNPNAQLARKNLAEAEKNLDDFRKFADRLKDEMAQLDKARPEKKLNEDVGAAMAAFGKEKEAIGKTAGEVQRLELARRGATREQLFALESAEKMVEYANKEAAAIKGLKDSNKELTETLAKKNLAKQGITGAAANALVSGVALSPQIREDVKQNIMLQDQLRASEIADSARSPREKAIEHLTEINRLHRQGMLVGKGYADAMRQVSQELYGVANASREAVQVGSAEYYAREFAYGRMLSQNIVGGRTDMGEGKGAGEGDPVRNAVGASSPEQEETVKLLKEIRDELRRDKGAGIVLKPVGIR